MLFNNPISMFFSVAPRKYEPSALDHLEARSFPQKAQKEKKTEFATHLKQNRQAGQPLHPPPHVPTHAHRHRPRTSRTSNLPTQLHLGQKRGAKRRKEKEMKKATMYFSFSHNQSCFTRWQEEGRSLGGSDADARLGSSTAEEIEAKGRKEKEK